MTLAMGAGARQRRVDETDREADRRSDNDRREDGGGSSGFWTAAAAAAGAGDGVDRG